MTWPASVLNVNKFHYVRGGSERHYFDLEAILTERGHRVLSFSMAHPENRPSREAADFVPQVVWRGGGGGLASVRRGLAVIYSRVAAARIEALLARERADIAHLHNVAHQISPSILKPLRARGIPVVQTLHDYKLICPNYRLFTQGATCERCRGGRYWNAFLHRCNRGALGGSFLIALESSVHRGAGFYQRGVDLFLAPSRFLMEKAIAFGVPEERIRHLPYPIAVPAEEGRQGGVSGSSVAEGGVTDRGALDDGTILYAGRLAPEKGIATLLAAAEQAPRVPIHIAGDGELRGEVAARATRLPNVTLHGHLSPGEVARLQRSARAVVVPSEWYENQPFAILEAFAAGKPAIASAIGGIPELVRDGETGLLFAPGDAAGLARALERAAAEPGPLAAMGARARSLVRVGHDPGAHYAALLAIYAEARDLARAGRPWRWRRAS